MAFNGLKLVQRFDHRIGRARHAALHEMGFFCRAILCDAHRLRCGCDRALLRQQQQRLGRHVFKFGGDGGTVFCQFGQASRVQVTGLHMQMADPTRWTVGVWVKHGGCIPKRLRGMDEHAAQLATTHHTQHHGLAIGRCAGQQRRSQ